METRVISSDLDEARLLGEELISFVQQAGFDEAEQFAIKLTLEEALVNAVKHGNGLHPEKHVTVQWNINPAAATFVMTDEGEGFDPLTLPDPTADENLERPCGRGVMLMRAYMDEVHYNEKGNELRVVKRRTP